MTRYALPLLAALGLAACAAQPPAPSARLPYDAVIGAGDPVRTAVSSTSQIFASPANLAGKPAAAARALAQMEFLAVELPGNPRFPGQAAAVPAQMAEARDEWRQALGVAPGVPAQPVIDSLYAASRALSAGQDASATLPPSIFPAGGAATLTKLAALPALPRTNVAAVGATDMFLRNDGMGIGRF